MRRITPRCSAYPSGSARCRRTIGAACSSASPSAATKGGTWADCSDRGITWTAGCAAVCVHSPGRSRSDASTHGQGIVERALQVSRPTARAERGPYRGVQRRGPYGERSEPPLPRGAKAGAAPTEACNAEAPTASEASRPYRAERRQARPLPRRATPRPLRRAKRAAPTARRSEGRRGPLPRRATPRPLQRAKRAAPTARSEGRRGPYRGVQRRGPAPTARSEGRRGPYRGVQRRGPYGERSEPPLPRGAKEARPPTEACNAEAPTAGVKGAVALSRTSSVAMLADRSTPFNVESKR